MPWIVFALKPGGSGEERRDMSFELLYMQILCVGVLILAAHFGGRLSRRLHFGEVVGQVIGGLVAGPVLLYFLGHEFPAYREALESLHFFTFLFLNFPSGLVLYWLVNNVITIGQQYVSQKRKS